MTGLDQLSVPPDHAFQCDACPVADPAECMAAGHCPHRDGPACRACGCTEDAACAWAAPGLCTACVAIVQRVFSPAELTFLLHAAGGGDLNLTRPSATALTAEGVLALRARLAAIAPTLEGAA